MFRLRLLLTVLVLSTTGLLNACASQSEVVEEQPVVNQPVVQPPEEQPDLNLPPEGPEWEVPKPQLPATWNENSPEAAKDAANYFVQLMPWAADTKHWDQFMALGSDYCKACKKLDEMYQKCHRQDESTWLKGGKQYLEDVTVSETEIPGVYKVVGNVITEKKIEKCVYKSEPIEKELRDGWMEFVMVKRTNRWEVYDYATYKKD